MSKVGEKIAAKLKSIGNVEFLDDKSQNPVSVPLWELSFLPIGILVYRFKQFFKIASLYAVFMSILALVSQLSYVCGMGENNLLSCQYSPAVYITFFFLRLLISAVFLRVWYKTAICGGTVKMHEMLTLNRNDWKIFGGMIITLLFLCLPIVSAYVLLYRVPNPDWKLESLFFAFASSGFWLPFIGLRFSSMFAFNLSESKLPKLRIFWQRTTGNVLKIIISLTLTVILNAVVFMYFSVFAVSLVSYTGGVGEILVEWLYNVIFLMMIASLTSLTIVQKAALFSWYSEEH